MRDQAEVLAAGERASGSRPAPATDIATPSSDSAVGITSTIRTWSDTTRAGTPGPLTMSGMCVAGFVDEEAVRQLAVLAEHLAVIAPRRRRACRRGGRRREGASSRRPTCASHAGDLGVVGAVPGPREARPERFRRLVRRVRVVEVDPREERAGCGPRAATRARWSTTSDPGRWIMSMPPALGKAGRDRSRRRSDRTPARSPSAGRGRRRRRSRRCGSRGRAGSRRASPGRRRDRSRRCRFTPCQPGNVPVISDECAGSVSGITVVACSKRSPDAASASICGVCAAA